MYTLVRPLVLLLALCAVAQADEPKPPLAFKAPAGWKADDGKKPAVIPIAARFTAGDGGKVVVTAMEAGGGLEPNVNRWRGQLNLKPLDAEGVKAALKPAKVDDRTGHRFDATAEGDGAQRIVVVIVPTGEGNGAWFIRISGPAAEVEKQLKAFDEFVGSVKFAK